jgi:hypothetical protein
VWLQDRFVGKLMKKPPATGETAENPIAQSNLTFQMDETI